MRNHMSFFTSSLIRSRIPACRKEDEGFGSTGKTNPRFSSALRRTLSLCRGNQCLSLRLTPAAVILCLFTVQGAFAQKHVEYSVYGGVGLMSAGGDDHDEMLADGYDFNPKLTYALGGDVKFMLSRKPSAFFIKPGLEVNKGESSYEKSTSSSSKMKASYLKGSKLVKYETTRYHSNYNERSKEYYAVQLPVTFGYQFTFGAKSQFRMAAGVLGLVGLQVYSRATVEEGWHIAYSPFYENGGKRVYSKVVDGDSSVSVTNHDIDIDGCCYGFGGQLSFYYWKLNARYSFRYEKSFSNDSDGHTMTHFFTLGYVF
ncbi:MAG: hypothetical protein MJY59_05200 [Bacteroidaceae bacterium]|nr:hypothetical protein [Bacteroidaceae bacterium]